MNISFNPFQTSKFETLAENFGVKAGKATGSFVKIGIFVVVGLILGLIFILYSLGKGFRKGFNEQKK